MLVIVVAGCGSVTDSAAAPATIGEACRQLNEAMAQFQARCLGGPVASWEAYNELGQDCDAYERHLTEGLVEYRPQGFAACMQKLAEPCDQGQPLLCPYEILFGKVPDGQRCHEGAVCGPLSACLDFSGDPCGRICMRAGNENEACGLYCGDATPCENASICKRGLACIDGTCTTNGKGVGEPCRAPDGNECAFPLSCDVDRADTSGVGVCVHPQAGAACKTDIGCLAVEFCMDGVCTPRQAPGGACSESTTPCSAWTICDTAGGNVCRAGGDLGQPCATPFATTRSFVTCATGACDPNSSTCVPVAPVGGACSGFNCGPDATCDPTSLTCVACPP